MLAETLSKSSKLKSPASIISGSSTGFGLSMSGPLHPTLKEVAVIAAKNIE